MVAVYTMFAEVVPWHTVAVDAAVEIVMVGVGLTITVAVNAVPVLHSVLGVIVNVTV